MIKGSGRCSGRSKGRGMDKVRGVGVEVVVVVGLGVEVGRETCVRVKSSTIGSRTR